MTVSESHLLVTLLVLHSVIFAHYVQRKVRRLLKHSLTLCHRGHCAPPAHLPPVAVWLIIMLRLAGCLAGGLQVNLILKSGAGCDVWGIEEGRAELVWSSASHLTLVNSSNETRLFLW